VPDAVVVFDDTPPRADTLRLRPGENLKTSEPTFRSAFGQLTSLEIDLLTFAASVFACDLAFKRGERENIARRINLSVPVVNLAIFNSMCDKILYALFMLSHDAWKIAFTQRSGTPEAPTAWPSCEEGKVVLFSGGLDSFAAALQLGASGDKVHLVSHITANRAVSGAQEVLFDYLSRKFPGRFSRLALRVSGFSRPQKGFPFPSDNEREDTQRTRSFLFLTLAGIYARRSSIKDIVVIAENGQFAINLPLTAARISAFSTHTAHPEFLRFVSEILSQILGYQLRIVNPFLYKTKSEVVKDAVTNDFNIVPKAVSCWKASRVYGSKNHCGSCVPCLIRRIAIEANSVTIPEYQRDLFAEELASLGAEDEGKRNLIELAEFVRFIESASSDAVIEDGYPELSNPHIDASQAISMYRRFANEARMVFNNYPDIKMVVK
jgi:7-cyano-7-deazaguanine synthase in queuosine biosynthesis